MAFIEEGFTEEEYREEVKKIVRRNIHRPDFYNAGWYEEFDARIWPIIREVIAEN